MGLAVVIWLDPGLGRLVQHGQRQIGHALQHGHQPAFHDRPERLDFAVEVRAVGERLLMQDAEPGQAFGDLDRRHGGAVVAHGGTRQTALQEGLRQPMGDVLGALRQVPLQVASEPGTVVEHAEQHWRLPFPTGGQNLA